MNKTYLCIDLKSFFASVECVERGLDPMSANLVVADPERSDKTICLAVSPAMRALGVKNRCRVFEIPKNIEYITAPPRMQKYIEYAANIYAVYLKYVAPEDIHVYSIDEVFMDVTDYLVLYKLTPREMAKMLMDDVYKTVGVRATAGIGTNLYLAKIALDITAKHSPDFIGYLDEESYKREMYDHRPLTDFWRIGPGIARVLEKHGYYTMGAVAALPETLLYSWFGVDAELLIDHAKGIEPTTIADIKSYKSKTKCLTTGQVLMRDYSFDEALTIVKEMGMELCLEMVDRDLVCDNMTLYVGYSNALRMEAARGSASLAVSTSSDRLIIPALVNLYKRITDKRYPVRRINISLNRVVERENVLSQISLFDDYRDIDKNRALQGTMIDIKKRYGKNAIVRGLNLGEEATGRERNRQIGGHKSGEE